MRSCDVVDAIVAVYTRRADLSCARPFDLIEFYHSVITPRPGKTVYQCPTSTGTAKIVLPIRCRLDKISNHMVQYKPRVIRYRMKAIYLSLANGIARIVQRDYTLIFRGVQLEPTFPDPLRIKGNYALYVKSVLDIEPFVTHLGRP